MVEIKAPGFSHLTSMSSGQAELPAGNAVEGLGILGSVHLKEVIFEFGPSGSCTSLLPGGV